MYIYIYMFYACVHIGLYRFYRLHVCIYIYIYVYNECYICYIGLILHLLSKAARPRNVSGSEMGFSGSEMGFSGSDMRFLGSEMRFFFSFFYLVRPQPPNTKPSRLNSTIHLPFLFFFFFAGFSYTRPNRL